MIGLKVDVEFIAASANTKKKSTVPDVSKLKERCFGVSANWLSAVWKKNCSIAGNAKTFRVIGCENSLMIKSRAIMAKELETLRSGISKALEHSVYD